MTCSNRTSQKKYICTMMLDCYTVGIQKDNATGWAFVIKCCNTQDYIEINTGVESSYIEDSDEFAINKAKEWCISSYPNTPYTIYTNTYINEYRKDHNDTSSSLELECTKELAKAAFHRFVIR
jgi:hypothetical protein